MRELSLLETQSVAPANFQRWALGGSLLAAVAYTVVALTAGWQEAGGGAIRAYSTSSAAIVCWIAVILVTRGFPRAGAALSLAAFWAEVHFGFLIAPHFPSPGLLGGPVIVMGVGLLFGQRWALMSALVSVVGTAPVVYLSSRHRGIPFSREEVYWLTVHAVVTLGSWVLISLSLAALGRVLEAVREKERELAEMIAVAPDGIVVIDSDDQVLAANPAAQRLLGLAGEQCVGRPIAAVLAAAGGVDTAGVILQLTDLMVAPVAWTLSRPGAVPTYVEVTWRRVDGGRRQLMLRDVSERVRADLARRAIETQLAHAQRLEAVGQLAGGIAHDFNNLLMAIGGSAELLRQDPDVEQREVLLDEVSAAQERGTALTRQLLAFARREVVHPTVLDLSALVTQLQRLLQRSAGDTVHLYCDVEPDCRVLADVGQMEQVLVNLVANARDASPAGGTCAITVARTTDAEGGRWVRLSVSDQGIGMDATTAARAFEPFFTTKPRGRGTGLGLASVHGIVLQSGGRVEVDSEPGRGTTIGLVFPFSSAPLVGASHAAPQRVETAESGATILVAEDDDSTRAIVGRILQRAGYHVLMVPNGIQALRHIESDPTAIAMLITDVVMPGMNGPQLAARVRERMPMLPILFMSGYPEDAMEAMERIGPNCDFLAKPFSGVELTILLAERLGVVAQPRASEAG